MRERVATRTLLGCALAAFALAVLGAGAVARATVSRHEAGTQVLASLDAQLEVLRKTDELLANKYAQRADELKQRVRATYKLMRSGWAPPWLERERSASVVQRRALVTRSLRRAGRELELLRAEVLAAARARDYLEGARQSAAAHTPPAPASLVRPVTPGAVVAPFGLHVHASGARLSRRGVLLAAQAGAPVRAAAAGAVRYAGPVRGLGEVVIAAHEGFVSVTGQLADLRVTRGQEIAAGDAIADAAGAEIYFELRLEVGGSGHPFDPAPLLSAAAPASAPAIP
ncbi:peptidoglycan DD-metalloendopeptidase family protein [Haliangium ochraceum]|uniref:Peptidase M23 n=1 Tax=Haliangium ochraceum (strain DSM 14365 / JCM 11303 / SMP-2) TaxID=502025 RepID=D0LZI3_HALO1|nr:peptidoglycan DD-metalloendopeptidase family protein [Haliangium ochraceum]ACY17962.1 Peptidase M23 [Haliangium ochraceum DSM 14365]